MTRPIYARSRHLGKNYFNKTANIAASNARLSRRSRRVSLEFYNIPPGPVMSALPSKADMCSANTDVR